MGVPNQGGVSRIRGVSNQGRMRSGVVMSNARGRIGFIIEGYGVIHNHATWQENAYEGCCVHTIRAARGVAA